MVEMGGAAESDAREGEGGGKLGKRGGHARQQSESKKRHKKKRHKKKKGKKINERASRVRVRERERESGPFLFAWFLWGKKSEGQRFD